MPTFRSLTWAGPLLCAAMLAAQQDPPGSPPTATAAERLAALRAEQKQLLADYQAKVKEAVAKAKDAAASGDIVPALPMRPDLEPLVQKAQAAAADYAGTDDAVPFLQFVAANAGRDRDAAGGAFTTLFTRHLDHASVAGLGPRLPMLQHLVPAEAAATVLAQAAKSASADLRGWALFTSH
jgi:ABC-type branched-subunit amino acid transport system substrate-binding protein